MTHLKSVDLSDIEINASIFTTRMPDKPSFSPQEVGNILSYSDETVRQLCQNKELFCFIHRKQGKEGRLRYRIPREFVIMYLMKHANFSDDDFVNMARQMFRDMPSGLRARILF